MDIKPVAFFISCVFLSFLSYQAYSSDFHVLAEKGCFLSLINKLNKLESDEARFEALHSHDLNGKTLLDIVESSLDPDHLECYQELVKIRAKNSLHTLSKKQRWSLLHQTVSKLKDPTERAKALNMLDEKGNTVLDYLNISSDHWFYTWIIEQGAVYKNKKFDEKILDEQPRTISDQINPEKNIITPSFAFSECAKSEADVAQELSVEEGKKAILKTINEHLKKAELDKRKNILELKNVKQNAINLIKAYYKANKKTFIYYPLNDGSGYEVFCSITTKGYDVYVIYPDRSAGHGAKSNVFFVQRWSAQTQDIVVVKKFKNTETEEFDQEVESAIEEELYVDAYRAPPIYHLYMPYLGITIAELPSNLPAALLNIIGYGVLKAINNLHKRAKVHGDIKPRNIFIDQLLLVRLGDLGEARKECATTNEYKGTPAFSPPEVNEKYSYSADNWAAALIIFMLLEPGYIMDDFPKNEFEASKWHEALVKEFPFVFCEDERDQREKRNIFSFELIQYSKLLTHKDLAMRQHVNDVTKMLSKWEESYIEAKDLKTSRKSKISIKPISGFKNLLKSSDSEGSSKTSPSSREGSPKNKLSPTSEKHSPSSSPKSSSPQSNNNDSTQIQTYDGTTLRPFRSVTAASDSTLPTARRYSSTPTPIKRSATAPQDPQEPNTETTTSSNIK